MLKSNSSIGLGHLKSQPLKSSSKQERNINNRQVTTKYLKNKGMHWNYQNGSMLHTARYNSYDGPKEVIEKTQQPNINTNRMKPGNIYVRQENMKQQHIQQKKGRDSIKSCFLIPFSLCVCVRGGGGLSFAFAQSFNHIPPSLITTSTCPDMIKWSCPGYHTSRGHDHPRTKPLSLQDNWKRFRREEGEDSSLVPI